MRNWTIHHGHCLDLLRAMPAESVHCCVTSPPYWGLRDYGLEASIWPDGWIGCLGLEPTPDLYVAHIVDVFREVRRVLRKDGTLWLNIGDCYARGDRGDRKGKEGKHHYNAESRPTCKCVPELKRKNMVGIPWRVAFALQTDGWYLRCDIIWAKPNPMPESVKDRPTKSHEYLFLMSKSERYYYDARAIKETVTGNAHARGNGVNPKARWKTPAGWDTSTGNGGHGSIHRNGRNPSLGDRSPQHLTARKVKQNESFSAAVCGLVAYRNKRTIWNIATSPFSEAHFATFPPKLVEPCILAGCPRNGLVLDPFNGAGTTGLVATRLGRQYIGLEIKSEYVEMAKRRIEGDAPLFKTEASQWP